MDRGQKNSVGISLRVIGRIRTPFVEATGTPIQSVYAQGVKGQVIVDDLFAAALDDIEGFDRVWLVYWFDAHPSSKAGWFDACGVDRKVADGRFHQTAGGTMKAASDIAERLRAFHARNLEYRRLGLDRRHAARLIVETAGVLRGPALDVGTGKGLLAIELARTGMEAVSVDVDAEEQELAKVLAQEAGVAGRIRFVCGDAAHLSYPDGTFGCVAMMDVLHHLDEPGPVLHGMARVLKNAGLIIVADFDEQGFDLVADVHRGEGRDHPRTATTIEGAMAELGKAGCRCLGRSNLALHDVVVLVKEP